MDKVVDAVKNIYGYSRNEVWGHLIYKPVKRARWKIPTGMTTLKEFVEWHRRMGKEQKRSDHPIALEIYAIFTTKKPLDRSELAHVISVLSTELLNAFFNPDLLRLMEWGYNYEIVPEKIPLESKIRYSRDGETWREIDISVRVLRRLGIEVLE